MEVPPNYCNPVMMKRTIIVKGGGRRSKQQRPGKEEPLVGLEEGGDREMLTIKESDLVHLGIRATGGSLGKMPSTISCQPG